MSGSGPGQREYEEYLRSAHWRHVRQTKLHEVHERCQVCGAHVGQLDVHHTTYERLGEELDGDLVVLCRVHHQLLQESGAVVPPLAPEWPWPGRDKPPTQRLCRAGFHWWETVTLIYPMAPDARSTVTRCRRCLTRRAVQPVSGGPRRNGPRSAPSGAPTSR